MSARRKALNDDRKRQKRLRKKASAAARRREWKRKYQTIFINGKQKRVPRERLIEGMTVDEFIMANADPIWLHHNEMWELMRPDDTIAPGESEPDANNNVSHGSTSCAAEQFWRAKIATAIAE